MSTNDTDDIRWLYPLYVVSAAGDANVPHGFDACVAAAVESFRTRINARPLIAESIYVSRLVHACGLWADRPLLPTTVPSPRGPVQDRVGSSYSGLFRVLTETLDADAKRLKATGLRCFKPIVVVVIGSAIATDDDWTSSLERLVCVTDDMSGSARAIVVPVALDAAQMDTVAVKMAMPASTSRGYAAANLTDLSEVLRSVLEHAAVQLVESHGANLLPDDDELRGSGRVISEWVTL